MGDVNNYNNNFVGFKGVAPTPSNGGQSLWQLPVPNVSIQKVPSSNFVDLILGNEVDTQQQMGFINHKVQKLNQNYDLTDEQINHGVFIEMVHYGPKTGPTPSYHQKGWKAHNDNLYDGNIAINGFEANIKNLYNNPKLPTRGGVQYYDAGISEEYLKFNRPNQIQITNKYQDFEIYKTLNGLFTMGNINFQNGTNMEDTTNCITPSISNKSSNSWGGRATQPSAYLKNFTKTYGSVLKNLYIAYRYIMWNPDLNNGKGNFVVGPTTPIMVVSPNKWPFSYEPQTPTNFNKVTKLNPVYVDLNNYCKVTYLNKLN